GEKSIAGKVELAGKLAVFFIALPVFSSLIEMLNHLL
ncbi:MAG: stage III sporulation AC/AD family protein, partial [Firmicutes bacterium]|nr:stage III sporulation AC/AD family protein [Bacillota bacterium]